MNTTSRQPMSRFVAIIAAAMLVLSLAAVPASAQTQEGLVNVNVSDVTVQAPIGIAANLCDIGVGVLAQLLRLGQTGCTATTDSTAVFDPADGPAPTQEGLVNVNVSDLVIQVPIAVAANICDLAVGVLARQIRAGNSTCDAAANSGDAGGNG